MVRFYSIIFSSILITSCLSVGRSDGARTLPPGKIELAAQVGIQSQDYERPNKSCGSEGGVPCGVLIQTENSAEEKEKERKNSFSFTNGIITLQGQGRMGVVESLDAGIFVSLTGIGLDLKKNWLSTETFAVATTVTGMTTGFSAVNSLADSQMSSVHLSIPLEANLQFPNPKASGVVVVAPLYGYYWKKFGKTREDNVTGVQGMVGVDLEAACQCILRLGVHAWYVQPRQIGLPTTGKALGIGLRAL